MTKDVLFEENSGLGLITLNRPGVLNALSTEMCAAIDKQLAAWEKDTTIKAVIIKAAGDKAFCAGGDVRTIVEQGHENNLAAKYFFATEYKMNARIFHFPKPFVALLDHGRRCWRLYSWLTQDHYGKNYVCHARISDRFDT